MARYNTTVGYALTSGAQTLNAPFQGQLTTLSGSAPYTVTLPNPSLFSGVQQTFYNAAGGTVTFSTPSGVFQGPGSSGASTQLFPNGATITIIPNGTNYLITSSVNAYIDTLVTTQSTFDMLTTTVNTVNAFTASSTLAIGANSGTLTIGNPTIEGTQSTITLFNGTPTTINAFQAATTISMGSNASNAAFTIRSTKPATSNTSGALVVSGGIATSGAIFCQSITAGGSALTTVGKAIAMALVFGG